MPLLFRKTGNSTTASASNLLIERDEGDKIQKYIDLLMPLLFETWMEVRPAKLNGAKSTTTSTGFDDEDICLTNEAAATLKTTLEIIEQLLELIRLYDYDVNGDDLIKWFQRKYGQEFFNQFLNGFPYQQADGFKGTIGYSNSCQLCQTICDDGYAAAAVIPQGQVFLFLAESNMLEMVFIRLLACLTVCPFVLLLQYFSFLCFALLLSPNRRQQTKVKRNGNGARCP